MDICLKSWSSYEYGNAEANATGRVSLLLVHSGAWPTDPKRLRQAFPLNAMLPIRQSRPVFANRGLCFQIIPFPRLPRSPIFEERSCQNVIRNLHIWSKIFTFFWLITKRTFLHTTKTATAFIHVGSMGANGSLHVRNF